MNDYVSPKLEARLAPHKGGHGVFAKAAVTAGELLIVWGGKVFTGEEFVKLPLDRQMYSIQIEENIYQVSVEPSEPADYVNHSCDPNAGLAGQISLVAMRDIEAGEEICFDYAMSDGSPYDEFVCGCGSPKCRGVVTGNDWQKLALQQRYAGYFSPYLQRRINRLQPVIPGRNGHHPIPSLIPAG